MTEWIIFAMAIAVCVVFFFAQGAMRQKKERRRKLRDLKEHYADIPEREYEHDEFESITHFFWSHAQEGFFIDDITWNDLDMDRIYCQINHSLTSAGDECLYELLRKPVFDKEELAERERLVRFFAENEEERLALQDVLLDIGRTYKVSISDYLYMMGDVKREGNLSHYLAILCAALSFLFIFVEPSMGMLLFIAVAAFNIRSYFKRKGEISPYLVTFSYILRLLKGIGRFEKLTIPACQSCFEELVLLKNKFKGFRRNSYLVMSSGGGNILELPLEYVRMFLHLDLIKFNGMLKELKNREKDVERIIGIIGYLECMISIGAFRKSLPFWCNPEFTGEKEIAGGRLCHPLVSEPVPNSVKEAGGLLVTGSNASGKSTFLKSVAVNALLAQTVNTVYAYGYRSGFFRIFTSMALRDSLLLKESYFIVEIKSLKRILSAAGRAGEPPVLCFVDEVLRGTNTVERIAASGRILKSLTGESVLCFAATHDIELTYILEHYYDNYHFEEEVRENDIHFSYELKEGRAVSRNAIRLLGVMGYDEEIIAQAERTAESFMEQGVWEVIE